MTNHESLLKTGQENDAAPEINKTTSMGVVLMIIAASGMSNEGPLVWTVLEQQSKAETDKIAGLISLPAETRKVGEQETDTLLAALGEFTNSDEAIGHLYFDPNAYYTRGPILVRGKPVDIAFLFYDGPLSQSLQSVDPSETTANGWMHTGEIQRLNGEFRTVARDSIEFATANGILDSLARTRRDDLIPLSSLVQPGFSIITFLEQREAMPDIPLS